MANWLIIGESGTIAGTLAAQLRSAGHSVSGTARLATPSAAAVLDLSLDPGLWPDLPDADVVVIAAALSIIAECQSDPRRSERVNLTAPTHLARMFSKRGAKVVFLSSAAVFDGTRPLVEPTASKSPVFVYGRHKSEAEDRILETAQGALVLRPTKVMTPAQKTVARWREALSRKSVIEPFTDLTMAPISDVLVATAIRRLVDAGATGVHQISATCDITYAQAARIFASALGASDDLVVPKAGGLSPLGSPWPPFVSLDMSATTALIGIEPPNPRNVIEYCAGDPIHWSALRKSPSSAVR